MKAVFRPVALRGTNLKGNARVFKNRFMRSISNLLNAEMDVELQRKIYSPTGQAFVAFSSYRARMKDLVFLEKIEAVEDFGDE